MLCKQTENNNTKPGGSNSFQTDEKKVCETFPG